MASQGPNGGSTFVDDASIGSKIWVTPENAVASDNVYSNSFLTLALPQSHYLKATGFGFSIPTTATITGVLVEVEGKSTIGENVNLSGKLVKSDVIDGTQQSAVSPFPTSDAYMSLGSSSNLWGLTLTPSNINASDFGVAVNASAADFADTASIDYIRITVFYSTGGGLQATNFHDFDWCRLIRR